MDSRKLEWPAWFSHIIYYSCIFKYSLKVQDKKFLQVLTELNCWTVAPCPHVDTCVNNHQLSISSSSGLQAAIKALHCNNPETPWAASRSSLGGISGSENACITLCTVSTFHFSSCRWFLCSKILYNPKSPLAPLGRSFCVIKYIIVVQIRKFLDHKHALDSFGMSLHNL